MKEIRTSGPLMFSDPNCPTRVGEIINTISEIYDIPNPSEGMQVYVRDEKKTYTITGLKEAVIGGERVPNAKVDTFEAVKSQVEEIDNNFAEMQEALIDGSFVVGVANLANAVKVGAVTFEMLDGMLQLSASVVDDLETANTLKPLSANQGKILKELIDIINGTGEGSTDKKITDAIAALVDSAPENLDTLRKLAEWIAKHGAEFAAVMETLKTHSDSLAELNTTILNYNRKIGNYAPVDKATVVANLGTAVERGMIVTYYTADGWKSIRYISSQSTAEAFANVNNWEDVDKDINDSINHLKSNTAQYNSLSVATMEDSVDILVENVHEEGVPAESHIVTIPAATTENAGVMSADDKKLLNKANYDLFYLRGNISLSLATVKRNTVYFKDFIFKGENTYIINISTPTLVSPLYINLYNIQDDSAVHAITAPSATNKYQAEFTPKVDCYLSLYYSETINVDFNINIANDYVTNIDVFTRLYTKETSGYFVNSEGKLTVTAKPISVYKVDRLGIDNIYAYIESDSNGNLAIAFYDANDTLLDGSVDAINTKGAFAWFQSVIPNNTAYILVTSMTGNGTPIIGSINPQAKPEYVHMIENLGDTSILKSEKFVDHDITINTPLGNISSYDDGTQFVVRIKELEGGNNGEILLTGGGISQRIIFNMVGDYWFEKTKRIESVSIIKQIGDSQVQNLSYDFIKCDTLRLLHRPVNSYIKTNVFDIGELTQGYYSLTDYDVIIKDPAWVTYPMQYSNGFKIHINTDFDTYYVNIKYIPSQTISKITKELTISKEQDIDLTDIEAWTVQFRRIDRATIKAEDMKDVVVVTKLEGDVFERPASKNEVTKIIEASLQDINASNIAEKVESIENRSLNALNFPLPTPNLYGHLFINDIYTSSNVVIPCQSVFDVAVSAKMGLKMIEANVLLTSDGIPVTGHQVGANILQSLTDLDGNPVEVNVANTTFEELRANYRYKSNYPQYRTPITSLEEFLRACKCYNITPFVGQASDAIVRELTESIVGKNYVAYGGQRSSTDVTIYHYKTTSDINELINDCKNTKPPYILGVDKLNTFSDDDIKYLLNEAHAAGCKVGWAGCYQTVANNIRFAKLGVDISASGWDIPDFDEGNEVCAIGNTIKGFSDFGKSDNNIALTSGSTLSVSKEKQSIISKGSFHIHFKGDLKIKFGYINETIHSDGDSEIVLTSVIKNDPSLSVTAVGDVELYSISYKVASAI